MTIALRVARLRCRHPGCDRRIFSARLPEVMLPLARRTRRVGEIFRLPGHSANGRTAERLLTRLGLAVSDDTVLRHLKSARRHRPSGIWGWLVTEDFWLLVTPRRSSDKPELLHPITKSPAERAARDIRRATRKHHSAEHKIRVVLEGLRGAESIAARYGWAIHNSSASRRPWVIPRRSGATGVSLEAAKASPVLSLSCRACDEER